MHVSSFTLLGDEHLVTDRVVNNTNSQFSLNGESDGNTVERKSVHKIGGAVNRIDNPQVFVLASLFQSGGNRICSRLNTLFPKDSMVGIMGQDQPADHLLHAFINFR